MTGETNNATTLPKHPVTVIIGVGLPGSGRSKYLEAVADLYGMTLVCPTDIRQELPGTDREAMRKAWEIAEMHLGYKLKLSQDVVINAVNARPGGRHYLVKMCRENGAELVVAFYFPAELIASLSLNDERANERRMPPDVIMSMHDQLQKHPPSMEDGFDEVVVVQPGEQPAPPAQNANAHH